MNRIKLPLLMAIILAIFTLPAFAQFKGATTAPDKREKMRSAVQAAFEKAVVEKYGDEVARTKGGRIALRATVLDSRMVPQALTFSSLKHRAVSSGMSTPEKPVSFIYLCDISMAGKPLACVEMDATFEPKRDVEILVNNVPAKKKVGAQVLRPANPASESDVTTSNPESVAVLRDLTVALPPAIGNHDVELRTYWFVDEKDPNLAFYFPNVETITVEEIGVLFYICRKEGTTDADDKAQFLIGLVPWNGKFPAAPMVTMNNIDLTPAEPSKVGPDPDFPFATLLTVTIARNNYDEVKKSWPK